MIAHQKISLEDSLTKSRIVDEVAQKMDRKFMSFRDSCFSFLWSEYDAIVRKPSCENTNMLRWALKRRASDYYRKNHIRHTKREVEDGEFPLVSRRRVSDSLRVDVSTFTESLNVEDKLIWRVVTGEKTGVEVAIELGLSAQSISSKVAKVRNRAQIYLRDYKHDCN